MTLFPKMDTDQTADKEEKPDNIPAADDKDQKQDEEYKVVQLFRELIAKFSNDEDKKNEGGLPKEEEGVIADDEIGPDGLPSRMNSPVPMYGGGVDGQHAISMPDDGNTLGQDGTIINSGSKPAEYAMPSILPERLIHFLRADDGGVSLVCIILNASIMQLIFGIICISLGIAAIVVKIPAYHIGDPIWTGLLFYVVTGLIGVATWRFPKDGLVVSYLVMSILSAFASLQLMAMAAFAMRMESYDYEGSQSGGTTDEKSIRYELYAEQIKASIEDGFSKSERLALEILIFFVAFIEMVFVIAMAVVTCKLWPAKTTKKQEPKDDTSISDNKNDFDLNNDTDEKPPPFTY